MSKLTASMKNQPVSILAKTDEVVAETAKWALWKSSVQPEWEEIRRWDEMYQFYKREGSETFSDVSMNQAFSIVENYVARLNDTSMTVNARAHGTNDMGIFERYIGNVIQSTVFDAKVEDEMGPFRKVKELWERDFLVKGNAVAEVTYCHVVRRNGSGVEKVVASNPATRPLPLFSVIGQPWKTHMTSDEYFVEKFVTFKYLQDNEKTKENPNGIYENVGSLQLSIAEDGRLTRTSTDQRKIINGVEMPVQEPPIRLLEHHVGPWMRVYANERVKIRDVYDPFKLGTHPLILGMNYNVDGRYYAYGEIAAIYKPIRAQDTIINQRIQTVNQYLRPRTAVDPNIGPDLDMVALIMEKGGVFYADPNSIKTIETQLPPSVAYTETTELQRGVELAARSSAYSSGIANSTSDTTQGTKGGILALQSANEPNFQIKLDGVKDMFLRPICRKYLPMIGNLMGKDDLKYGEMQGEDRPWLAATKNMLLGIVTLKDLHTVGMLTDAGFAAYTTTPVLDPATGQPPIDPQTGQPAVNPQTGQPLTQPIPGSESAHMVEVDWLVDVTLDMRSSSEKQTRLQNLQNMIKFLADFGVHMNPARLEAFIEPKMEELKGLSTVILTQEEQQQQSSQMPREQLRVQVNFQDLPTAGKMQAAAQAGIQLTPQDLNEHAANQQLMQHSQMLNENYSKAASKAAATPPQIIPSPAPVASNA